LKKNIKFSEHHTTYVIPAKAGIHLLYFFSYFLPPSVIANFRRNCGNPIIQLMSFPIPLMSFPRRRESILCISFCITFYFFLISSLAYNPNPLLLYKLNTKYQRLTTDFNNYALFLCNILRFFDTNTIKKLYF